MDYHPRLLLGIMVDVALLWSCVVGWQQEGGGWAAGSPTRTSETPIMKVIVPLILSVVLSLVATLIALIATRLIVRDGVRIDLTDWRRAEERFGAGNARPADAAS